jgi:hypothetical protein
MTDAPSTFATQTRRRTVAQAPRRLWLGLLLAAGWWAISWGELRPFSEFSFFPLWLGYILTIDGLVTLRTGTSPISRSGWRVAWLFVLSAPFWWLFEAINLRLDNWHYDYARTHSVLSNALWSSLAFSTVIPAVLTTAELVRAFGIRSPAWLPAWNPGRRGLLLIAGLGALSLVAMLIWPRYLFPLCWLSLFFIFDPIGRLLGARTLSSYVADGDWSPVLNLALAGLICGWFWEMWNFYAMPRWSYSVPFAELLHIWEMPLLGYGGYVPFALEVYALYAIAVRLLGKSVLPDVRITTSTN